MSNKPKASDATDPNPKAAQATPDQPSTQPAGPAATVPAVGAGPAVASTPAPAQTEAPEPPPIQNPKRGGLWRQDGEAAPVEVHRTYHPDEPEAQKALGQA